eukprot:CAMPEP_0113949382 /NCGR_PEP_ID=MMETSP1339-20121228/75483_1 /TAXON_ID=94617 /ORGANISM="Fibrocapsa japonica" /LENGTH=99 /DNA_ID=CAMNT_0000956805 /DNA_START=20 /DNA_END=315 /DNA_ORIENTATION=+ /assembly_acc=CAM_ASM_000762
MWPISTVEGVVSAVTTRVLNEKVRLKFERTVNMGEPAVGGGAPTERKDAKLLLAEALRTFRELQRQNSTYGMTQAVILDRAVFLVRNFRKAQNLDAVDA